jgi:hypothetical protein
MPGDCNQTRRNFLDASVTESQAAVQQLRLLLALNCQFGMSAQALLSGEKRTLRGFAKIDAINPRRPTDPCGACCIEREL